MNSVSSQKIQWGWASAIWQLDSLFDTVRIVCGAGSIKRSGVRLSASQSVPSVERSSGVRRVCCWAPYAQKLSIDSAGRPAAAAPQPGAAARRSAANAGNVTLTAEYRLNTYLGYFLLWNHHQQFWEIWRSSFDACKDTDTEIEY